jgi:hypothetical protein
MRLARGPLAQIESGFVGEIYEFVIRRPVLGIAQILRNIDSDVVDGTWVGVGRFTRSLGEVLKITVSGNAHHYGLIMAAGMVVLLALAISIR